MNESNKLIFKNRNEFRQWLAKNAKCGEGVWLIFGKTKSIVTITAKEALEEALCFGWIDGVMQSIDDNYYMKYFKERNDNSNWSEKNKKTILELEAKSLMTDFGRAKVNYAKENGNWNNQFVKPVLTEDQIKEFEDLIKPFNQAHENFIKMSPSTRKTYALSYYFGSKTEEGKKKRFDNIIERLELNLNPMESMKNKNIDK